MALLPFAKLATIMKRYLLALTFIVTVLSAQGQNRKQRARLESDKGIRDIKLKSHISLYKDLNQVYSSIDCISSYERRNEDLQIGNTQARRITYNYVDDELIGFTIAFKTNAFYNFIDSFRKLYGKPKYKSRDLEGYGKPGDKAYYWLWKSKSLYLLVEESGNIETSGIAGYIGFYLKEGFYKCKNEKNPKD